MLHDRNILNKNNSADNADIQYQINSLYHGLELLIKNYEPQQPTQLMPYIIQLLLIIKQKYRKIKTVLIYLNIFLFIRNILIVKRMQLLY